jgi:hypothetical protein
VVAKVREVMTDVKLVADIKAIPKSASDLLVKKIQNREQNFIIWNSYIHNCIILHIVTTHV